MVRPDQRRAPRLVTRSFSHLPGVEDAVTHTDEEKPEVIERKRGADGA